VSVSAGGAGDQTTPEGVDKDTDVDGDVEGHLGDGQCHEAKVMFSCHPGVGGQPNQAQNERGM
jgi:hypothetical protein